jgi:hypothetical protein
MTREKYDVLTGDGAAAPEALLFGLKREMAAHPRLAGACTRIS